MIQDNATGGVVMPMFHAEQTIEARDGTFRLNG
jgi:hypothetical protein